LPHYRRIYYLSLCYDFVLNSGDEGTSDIVPKLAIITRISLEVVNKILIIPRFTYCFESNKFCHAYLINSNILNYKVFLSSLIFFSRFRADYNIVAVRLTLSSNDFIGSLEVCVTAVINVRG
jgi:hypothetical protein